MKSAAIIFRLLVVCASCAFFSGSALTTAKEMDAPEGVTDPVMKVEYGLAPESLPSTESVTPKAEASGVIYKKAAAPIKKGLVYLPLISLSSYVPVGAQILLMILVISMSGLFGAWLMFRFLANKVMAFEERTTPSVTAAPSVLTVHPPVVFEMQTVVSDRVSKAPVHSEVGSPLMLRGERARAQMKRRIVLASDVSPVEVKKKSRKEKKKVQKRNKPSGKYGESSGVLVKVGDRLVLKRPGELQAATSMRNAADVTRKNRMPQSFLINEWFPLDQQ